MIAGALFYYQYHSLKNRLMTRVKRLRQPKYLVGAVVGALYFYFYLFRGLARGRGGAGAALPVAPQHPGLGESLAALALLVMMLLAWILPHSRAALGFTEAEVSFLFPAPIGRRALINFKLLKSQAAILFSALLMTIIGRGWGGGSFAIRALGWWVWLAVFNLHLLGSSFALTHADGPRHFQLAATDDLSRGSRGRGRNGLDLDAWRAAAGPAGLAVPITWRNWRITARRCCGRAAALFAVPVPAGGGAVFRAQLEPLLGGPGTGAGNYRVALLVGHALERRIRGGLDGSFPQGGRTLRRRASGQLAVVAQADQGGAPAIRVASPGQSRRGGFLEEPYQRRTICDRAVLADAGLGHRFRRPDRAIANAARRRNRHGAVHAGSDAAGDVALSGPQLLRNDLRQDLPVTDVLKMYPMPGWQIVLGEVLRRRSCSPARNGFSSSWPPSVVPIGWGAFRFPLSRGSASRWPRRWCCRALI